MTRPRWRGVVPLLAGAVVLTSCATTTGSGTLTSESRAVRGFSAVDLSGSGNLSIQQTGTESITIEAEDNIVPLLTSDVSGTTLMLGVKSRTSVTTTMPITYRLTVKDLSGISVSGSGDVIAAKLTAGTLKADLSGSGTITVGGSADAQKIDVSGSGSYQAGDLATRAVDVDVSGSGDVVVRVSDELRVEISGSGTLTYSGSPTVTQDISGSGEVIRK
jgi:hypothetical protein